MCYVVVHNKINILSQSQYDTVINLELYNTLKTLFDETKIIIKCLFQNFLTQLSQCPENSGPVSCFYIVRFWFLGKKMAVK